MHEGGSPDEETGLLADHHDGASSSASSSSSSSSTSSSLSSSFGPEPYSNGTADNNNKHGRGNDGHEHEHEDGAGVSRARGGSSTGAAETFPRVTLSWEGLRYSVPVPPPPLHRRIVRWCSPSYWTSSSSSPPSSQRFLRGDGADDEDALLLTDKQMLMAETYEKEILRGVEGIVHPGELCAIMGASGAGKTTLLDVLAARGVHGRLTGEVRINGQPVKKQSYFRRISGLVMQDTLLLETLTVRETLSFAARLKLPSHMSREQKERRVDELLMELGLDHIANSRVGNQTNRGISGGELKRVAIALELVSSPPLLFLDEPTSGLDSHGATNLIFMLKNLAAKSQHTVLCTIHQPSSHMFRAFDKLLLLAQGRVLYFGKASQVVDYFENMSIVPPPHTNPADFILDIAFHARKKDVLRQGGHDPHYFNYNKSDKAQNGMNVGSINRSTEHREGSFTMDQEEQVFEELVPTTDELADRYLKSHHYDSLSKELDAERSSGQNAHSVQLQNISKYGVPVFMQMWLLLLREFLFMARHPQLFNARFGQQVVMGLLIGAIWFQLSEDSSYIQNTEGVLFMTAALLSFVSFSSVPNYIEQRAIFNRERAAGMYHSFPYFIAKMVVSFLLLSVLVIMQSTIIYWMVGLRHDEWYYFFIFLFIMLVTSWTGEALIFAVCNIAGGTQVAQAMVGLCLGFFFIFAGFYINTHSIPSYFVWAKYSSFIKYGFEALVYNEFIDRVVQGVPGSVIIDGSTQALGLWVDIGILGGMAGAYLILAYLALHFLHKERR